jgi:hypothetical protein
MSAAILGQILDLEVGERTHTGPPGPPQGTLDPAAPRRWLRFGCDNSIKFHQTIGEIINCRAYSPRRERKRQVTRQVRSIEMRIASWKVQFDSVLAGVSRDMQSMSRDAREYLSQLDTTERLILLGLAFIGLFYLLIRHFRTRTEGEEAEQKSAGLLFVIVAFAVGFGWIASSHRLT